MRNVTRRDLLRSGLIAGGVMAFPACSKLAASANDEIRLGFISCGSRAGQLMGPFTEAGGTVVAGLCDPDAERLGSASRRFPKAKTWTDLRKLLDDPDIDAVVISACNHWHCLAAIWAMEADKDVYVEKPLSHSQWEGRQTVAAAEQYKKICQVGTQQRSDPMQAEIKQFLHQERGLGNILAARVNRFGVRGSIGKRETPLPIPPDVDYDLWLGPAQDQPIYRDKLQYDWHWDWNTGSGEMGNWGVHVLDDTRNNVFLDKVTLPKRILAGGGRVVWNDAGNTPNVHFVYFDTGTIPVVIGLTNLPEKPGGKGSPEHPGPGSGYLVVCEGGRLEGQRGRAAAFDKQGQKIKEFRGNSGNGLHQQNFLDAVRRRDPGILNASVEVGHHSTGWCNLANVGFRAGGAFSAGDAASLGDSEGLWTELLEGMQRHLNAYGIKLDDESIRLSPVLEMDPATEKFVGQHAGQANAFLKREYREPYVVPEFVA